MKLLRKLSVRALAIGVGTIGVLLVMASYYTPENSFAQNMLSNLASEVIGIALTVGVVDFLLERNREHEFKDAAAPRVAELATSISNLTAVGNGLPALPTKDDLINYRGALKEVISACQDLRLLVASRKPRVASELSSFARSGRVQLSMIDNLIIGLLNQAHAADAFEIFDKSRQNLHLEEEVLDATLGAEGLVGKPEKSQYAIGGRT